MLTSRSLRELCRYICHCQKSDLSMTANVNSMCYLGQNWNKSAFVVLSLSWVKYAI